MNSAPVPALYPNAVTLTPDAGPAVIRALARLELPGRWGVKDSFATLDLGAHGFDLLFDAQWLHLEATAPVAGPVPNMPWHAVRTPEELEAWEAAWRGPPPEAASAQAPRVFPPALLQEEGVVFLRTGDAARPLAGGVASLAAGAIGLSNTFLSDGAPPALYAGLLASVRARFPGLPLVGYEHGDALETWCGLGMSPVGPLRVWLKRAA